MKRSQLSPKRAFSITGWTLLTFVGILATSQWLLEPGMTDLRDVLYSRRRNTMLSRFQEKRQQQAAQQRPDPKLVVILGTSRTANDFNGSAIEQTLSEQLGREVCFANFGTAGAGPVNQLVLLGRLLREPIKPDIVMIEVLPAFLCDHENITVYKTGVTPLTQADARWLKDINFPVDDQAPRGLALSSYRTEILKAIAPKLLPRAKDNVWVEATDPWGGFLIPDIDDVERRAKSWNVAKESYGPILRDFKLGTAATDVLKVMLKECQKHEIPAMVVVLPEGPVFRNLYRPGARAEIEAALRRVTNETGSELISRWEWEDDSDFLDSHHLLSRGATKFTERFCQDDLAPLLHASFVAREGDASVRR